MSKRLRHPSLIEATQGKSKTAIASPAETARTRAGYSLESAARKLRLSPRYLRQIELHGGASIKTARRLARLYQCSGNVFLHSPEYFHHLGHGAATETASASSATAGADTRVAARASRRYQPPKTPLLSVVPSNGTNRRDD